MRLTSVVRLINQQTMDSLKKVIKESVDEAPQHLKQFKENQQAVVYNKISNLNKWYTKIIGLDEVNQLQDKVITIQDRLLEIQERRREIGRQLTEIRQKSVELQDQLHKVKRQDDMDKFLELMKEETEVLKLEQSVSRTFQDYDRTEREIFTAFTNAIRDSHEKQRAQMEYTRYFGLVLGIAGSFLTFVYSTVRKHDLKRFIEKNLQNVNLNYTLDTTVIHELSQSTQETKDEITRVGAQVNQLVNVIYRNNDITTPVEYPNDHYTIIIPALDETSKSLLKIFGGFFIIAILLNTINS